MKSAPTLKFGYAALTWPAARFDSFLVAMCQVGLGAGVRLMFVCGEPVWLRAPRRVTHGASQAGGGRRNLRRDHRSAGAEVTAQVSVAACCLVAHTRQRPSPSMATAASEPQCRRSGSGIRRDPCPLQPLSTRAPYNLSLHVFGFWRAISRECSSL